MSKKEEREEEKEEEKESNELCCFKIKRKYKLGKAKRKGEGDI